MPAELELPGPRYKPMSGVQPGSVGELGQSPPLIPPSVPPVEPLLLLMTLILILALNRT